MTCPASVIMTGMAANLMTMYEEPRCDMDSMDVARGMGIVVGHPMARHRDWRPGQCR